MDSQELKQKLNTSPDEINFQDVMHVIENEYTYTPSRFTNGKGEEQIVNEAGTNEGSCKIFSFGLLNELDEQQTLACFGEYYREDVLKHPDNTDHANIRSFMKYGWEGIVFEADALSKG